MTDTSPTRVVNKSTPLWAKIVLLLAVVCIASGIALPYLVKPEPTPASALTNSLNNSLSASGAEPIFAQDHWTKDWSPAIFRLGFSFVVGFAVAFALRWAVKTALIVAGLFALAVLGLQYSGLVDVKWGMIENHYDEASSWLSSQTKSFTAFITGALPSGASAAAGLFAGFKKG
jgi:uncharacterized membrane protein (Fun14 family)